MDSGGHFLTDTGGGVLLAQWGNGFGEEVDGADFNHFGGDRIIKIKGINVSGYGWGVG